MLDGLGTFGAQQVITTAADDAWFVFAADLDGDGDIDVLSASAGDDKIAWYQNLLLTSVTTEGRDYIKSFKLSQNYPNPFNPSTTIEFTLPNTQDVQIVVYNISGQRIKTLLNKKMKVGRHNVEFNASELASGIYIYHIQAGGFQDVKKMVLLR